MNAPFLVPTSTRTLLMKCSSPFFQALFLTKSLKRNQINFARVAARASGLRGNTVQATRVRQNKPGTAFGGADSRRIATAPPGQPARSQNRGAWNNPEEGAHEQADADRNNTIIPKGRAERALRARQKTSSLWRCRQTAEQYEERAPGRAPTTARPGARSSYCSAV